MLHEQGGMQANDAITEIDEHDEPTEPMRRADVDAFIAFSGDIEIPSPKSSTHPFPHQYVQQPLVIPSSPAYLPPTNVGSSYPVLPPRPTMQGGQRPAGGMPSQEESLPAPKVGQNARRKFVPVSVGMCFVAIQIVLLVRFVLKLLQSSPDNSWVGVLYDISNVFVLPFRLLFLQYSVPLFGTLEVYTLLAILVYGVVSRIVVRSLKLLLKTR
jgi:hypothetical protein